MFVPLVVPKMEPAMYRLIVEHRPVIPATVKNAWPQPYIDTVLQDVCSAEAFAAIDLTFRYWPLPFHVDSQHLQALIAPDVVKHQTRLARERCSSPAKFQACIDPCYSLLRENNLAWLDDFVLIDFTEDGFLRIRQRFFELPLKHNLTILLR